MRWKCNAPFVNNLAMNFMLHLLNSVKLYTRDWGRKFRSDEDYWPSSLDPQMTTKKTLNEGLCML